MEDVFKYQADRKQAQKAIANKLRQVTAPVVAPDMENPQDYGYGLTPAEEARIKRPASGEPDGASPEELLLMRKSATMSAPERNKRMQKTLESLDIIAADPYKYRY